ncbi:MAG: TonB-dependent receptor [Gallionella sp.]|nr:TonB-dependent receptor [Gallionella sp.]
MLPELVVTATRSTSAAERVPAAVTVVVADDIADRDVTRLGDALKQVPSLYLRGGALGQSQGTQGTSSMSLRGIDQSRTLVLLDGQPLQDAGSGKVNWRVPFVEDIDRIEVVPGAYSALYGSNAIGGVINIISKRPDRKEFGARIRQGSGDAAGTDASLYFRDKLSEKWGIVAGLGYQDRASYVNEFVVKSPSCPPPPAACTPGIPVSGAQAITTRDGTPGYLVGDLGRTPWRTLNATAKLFHELDARSTLYTAISHQQTDQRHTPFNSYLRNAAGDTVSSGTLDIAGKRVVLSNYDFTLLSFQPLYESSTQYRLGYDGAVSDDMLLKVELASMVRKYRYALASPTATWSSGSGTLADTPNHAVDANVQLGFPLGERHFMVSGVALHQDAVDQRLLALSAWRDPSSATAVNGGYHGRSSTWSIYAQDEFGATDRLTLYLGGRWDEWRTRGGNFSNGAPPVTNVYPERTVAAFSPKLSAVYRHDGALTLRTSYGRSFRAPTHQDLYTTSISRGRTTSGDPDLQPESGATWELGGDWRPHAASKLNATLYSTELRDLVYLQQLSATQSLRINAGRARVNGVELALETRLASWLTLGANYARIDTRMLENLADPASVGKRLTDVPDRIIGFALKAQQGEWNGRMDVRYVSHVYWTAQNTDVVEGVPGSYDAHTLVDVGVGYDLSKHVHASLNINNLFDRKVYAYFLLPRRNLSAELRFSY